MRYISLIVCVPMLAVLAGCITTSQPDVSSLAPNSSTTMTTTPTRSIIGDTVGLTQVTLYVRNLDVMKRRYGDILGLDTIQQDSVSVSLGSQNQAFLKLIQQDNYQVWTPQSAGLYHVAYLHATQQSLAQRLLRIAQQDPNSFGGSSDHSVSEAFYFTDPEGNGVELYYDRDPSTRQWRSGQVVMGSAYLDPNDYIARYAGVSGSWIDDSSVGHIHLQVGDLALARQFYADVLGFDVTSDSSNGALFVSAGGYHHHFGLNVRNSNGAGKRLDNQYGLAEMVITLPSQQDIDDLKDRLTQADVVFTNDDGLRFSDPWNNKFTILSL